MKNSKLESLKKDKFAGFEQNQIKDSLAEIKGGLKMNTSLRGREDTYNDETKGHGARNGAGKSVDFDYCY